MYSLIKYLFSLMKLGIIIVFLLYPFFSSTVAQHSFVSDIRATNETKILYNNLFVLKNKGVMFGHQDDLAYGVGWKNIEGRSDVKEVTGSYPAVYGWDLGHLENDSLNNFDGVPFTDMVKYVKEIYDRGGINTISWHFKDPVTDSTAWSKPGKSVNLILTDSIFKAKYTAYLDKFATLVKQFKGKKGEPIPIIFRPLHEHTGNWFWWGKSSCSPAEFIALWKYTVDYLRNKQKLHNILYAYSAADFATEGDYLERYPGDQYVDILGFDLYADKDSTYFTTQLNKRSAMLISIAKLKNKLPALTEVGYENQPDSDWWTQTLLPVITKYQFSYMLTWRNWKESHFFAPYPGHATEADFKLFYKSPVTLFQKDIKSSIYRKALKR
ncbi:beta-mannosidase [Mucilaginibacter hurinus]|uniref:Mannan endo-1,4-beta-mannosidase n=1 Tax=Mucilaginibacter hurinus TaxID=2201324 RepID=A0A367GSK8_9SPHI|nr:glycosyl hydrolase [Mucilaginibacter hurinus]RCH56138.1 beta-mannosidase [Mucilaginibacter hurinus]